jgi:hypothetical protein
MHIEVGLLLIDLGAARPPAKISVAIPANVGIAAFAHSYGNKTHEVISTIPLETLLLGMPLMDISAGISTSLPGQIRASCGELMEIADRRKLTALMFIVGAKVTVNQFAATAQLLRTTNLLSDLKNNESKIDKTTVKEKRKGGMIAIKFAQAGKQDAKVESERLQQRIINRSWLEEIPPRATAEIEIGQPS